RPSILAAGPLTFEEAEALMSSLPPPPPEGAAEPDGAPAPEEPTAEPADEVERCSCEEALALRAELAKALADHDALHESLHDARAEVERLRACAEAHVRDNVDLDEKLAAANALL